MTLRVMLTPSFDRLRMSDKDKCCGAKHKAGNRRSCGCWAEREILRCALRLAQGGAQNDITGNVILSVVLIPNHSHDLILWMPFAYPSVMESCQGLISYFEEHVFSIPQG